MDELQAEIAATRQKLAELTFEHPCGLSLTADETDAFNAVPPARVGFKARAGSDHGDIFLDLTDTGWGSRSDAERAAAYFGTVVIDVEPDAEYIPRHQRRDG